MGQELTTTTKMPQIDHAQKFHELPDSAMADLLPVAKKVALAIGAENYNILQVSLGGISTLISDKNIQVKQTNRPLTIESCPLEQRPYCPPGINVKF